MNTENKNEIKKNVATGASTAAGATAGVVIGAALSPEQASAQEVSNPESTHQPTSGPKPTPTPTPTPEPTPESTPKPEPQPTPEPNPEPQPNNDEIQVISYDRVTNEDESQMDIAVLNVNGNEVGVMDVNLDGEADVIICDANHNGVIEEGESQIVIGEGISMQPFADAAGFTPLYAQNDLPDYVNDADVDTYMA